MELMENICSQIKLYVGESDPSQVRPEMGADTTLDTQLLRAGNGFLMISLGAPLFWDNQDLKSLTFDLS